jgi:hypothetical protein
MQACVGLGGALGTSDLCGVQKHSRYLRHRFSPEWKMMGKKRAQVGSLD